MWADKWCVRGGVLYCRWVHQGQPCLGSSGNTQAIQTNIYLPYYITIILFWGLLMRFTVKYQQPINGKWCENNSWEVAATTESIVKLSIKVSCYQQTVQRYLCIFACCSSNNGGRAWIRAPTNTGQSCGSFSTKSIKRARRVSLYTKHLNMRLDASCLLEPTETYKHFWGFCTSDQPSFRPTTTYMIWKWLDTLTLVCVGSRGRAGHMKRNWHTTAFCATKKTSPPPPQDLSYRAGEKTASRCWAKPSRRRMHKGGENSAPLHTGPTRPAYIKSCSRTPCLCLSARDSTQRLLPGLGKWRHSPQSSRDRGERALFHPPLCPIHAPVKGVFPTKITQPGEKKWEYNRVLLTL